MEKSKFFLLNWRDFLKGFIVAVITVLLTGLYQAIEAGQFPTSWTQWKAILIASLGAGIAYIIKNLLSNSQDKFLKK